MTKTKAIEILKQHGFEITSPATTRSYQADILHPVTGSHLHGRIYEDSLNINPTLKAYRADLWFNFGQGSSSTSFVGAVEKLEDELKHYDEILREKRVKNVRKYFKERPEETETQRTPIERQAWRASLTRRATRAISDGIHDMRTSTRYEDIYTI